MTKKYTCKFCEEKFKTLSDAEEHELEQHKCPNCVYEGEELCVTFGFLDNSGKDCFKPR